MPGHVTLGFQKARQRRRQLMVHEKVHAPCSTTWSAWCAAYSIAARMSSRSRSG
jgi:hypothetical protein